MRKNSIRKNCIICDDEIKRGVLATGVTKRSFRDLTCSHKCSIAYGLVYIYCRNRMRRKCQEQNLSLEKKRSRKNERYIKTLEYKIKALQKYCREDEEQKAEQVEELKSWQLVTIKPMIFCSVCKRLIGIGYDKDNSLICRECLHNKIFSDVK